MSNTSTYNIHSKASNLIQIVLGIVFVCSLLGCSETKHLTDDQTLVNHVKLHSADKNFKVNDYKINVRQNANSKWFNIAKIPLYIYNLSGSDTTRRWNKFVRRIGEAPVVYDDELTAYSQKALTHAMKGKGYLHAVCKVGTTTHKQKTTVNYTLDPGPRYYITQVKYAFDNDSIRNIILSDSLNTLLRRGIPLNTEILYSERSRIIKKLRNMGYYRLNNEYISFTADTTYNSTDVVLTMHFSRPVGTPHTDDYQVFSISKVNVQESSPESTNTQIDTSYFRNITYTHQGDKIDIYRKVYDRILQIRPDSIYRDIDVQNTNKGIGALSAVKFGTVRLTPSTEIPGTLDATMFVETNKPHSVSLEVEGTNTSGDLGAAVVLGYSNNNIFRGSESLTLRLRGAYEAIRGLEGYSNQDYIEYSGEVNLQFPTFKLPRIGHKVGINATSNLSVMYNSQDRPEFHRRLITASWGYKWHRHDTPTMRHRFDLVSLNYVFMPWISETFQKEYLDGDDPRYAVLRYSYENLLIMKTSYNLSVNSQGHNASPNDPHTGGHQIKLGVETAGNLLHGIAHLTKNKPDKDGQYSLLGIPYSQYAKFDFDIAKSFLLNHRNSIAMHAAFGIAIPYGNSRIIPYEKRYFSGGANSVRGWSVRSLGPGRFKGEDGKVDFINHTGNVKLDLSIELRSHLFWKLHGAIFIDAGNVWNVRTPSPEGQFRFDKFYKELAASYGIGLRLCFDYFILRLDGGMKAINPCYTDSRQFPIIHPRFSRDFALHFAVGLPF